MVSVIVFPLSVFAGEQLRELPSADSGVNLGTIHRV
jgi:hypothetical protein